MTIKPPECPPLDQTEIKKLAPITVELPKNIDPKLLKILKKYKYNWRLQQLSVPTRINKKYEKPKDEIGKIESSVKPGVLTGKIPERTKDLMATPLWKLNLRKKDLKARRKQIKKKLRKKLFKGVNKGIKTTWNSVYYYYRKAIAAKKKKAEAQKAADAKGKKKGKNLTEKLKEAVEYCKKLAVPKKVPEPAPRKNKVVKDWGTLLMHLESLAEPTHKVRKYKRPSVDSKYEDLTKVKPKALKYKITAHVEELAHKIPERYTRKEKPIIPGRVKKGALTAKITPRIEEISAPKKRADAPEMDVKENPFSVSKNALKYKPTPRIEELAKPKER